MRMLHSYLPKSETRPHSLNTVYKPSCAPYSHHISTFCTLRSSRSIEKTLNMKGMIILLCVVAAALAAPGYHGGYGHGGYGPAQRSIYHNQQIDGYGYSGPYNFGYTVNDPYTGDYHGQDEKGDGKGGVAGSYHLREADGSLRVVKYVADYGGFRATVNGVPHGYAGYH